MNYPPPPPPAPAATYQPPWRLMNESFARGLAMILTIVAYLLIVVAGVVGASTEDIVAGLVVLTAGLVFIRVFARRASLEYGQWLATMCQIAFVIRVIVATIIYAGPWDRYMFGEDQYGYDYIPHSIMRYWNGETGQPPVLLDPRVTGRIGYYYLVSALYYFVTPGLLGPRVLNCLAGALMVYYAFRLATVVFGRAEGRVAAVWTTVFPSLIIWSSLNMRDIWLALSVVVIVWHAVAIRVRMSFISLAVIAGHFAWIQYNRSYLVLIMFAATLGIFLLARGQSLGRDFIMGGALLGVLAILRFGLGYGQEGMTWLDLDRVTQQRDVLARTDVGASGYLPGLQLSNPVVLVSAFPLLLSYFLFSPFPWQMLSARRLITLPEMVMWYWMVPFLLRGFRDVLRERVGRQISVLVPIFIITSAYAISSANMGLAYRYRAQVIVLYLVFVSAGYVRKKTQVMTAAHARMAPGLALQRARST